MRKPLYLTKMGELSRDQNRLRFDMEGSRPVFLPIERIESIFVFHHLELNTSLLELLSRSEIPVHFFDYYGRYTGSFMPKEGVVSGYLLTKQVQVFADEAERLRLSRELLRGVFSTMRRNFRLIATENDEFREETRELEKDLNLAKTIPEIMAIEGNIRRKYYASWDAYHKENFPDFILDGRVKRPPNNRMNSLVSFLNTMVYAITLNEIYQTALHPAVSFLHESSARRYSLSLDVSELFKPLLVDRLIFHLVHRKMLKKSDFDEASGLCYLNEEGKNLVIKELKEKLESTVHHKELGRKVSYKRLIRLELYKLVKDITGEQKYQSLKVWW